MGRSAVGLRESFRTFDHASYVRLRLPANRTYAQSTRVRGFTLIELVMVILLLGVMATFSSQFIGIGTEIYGDASRREQLMSDARFALERLNRELWDAVPGSVRVEDLGGDLVEQGACLRFWPIATASRYLSLNKPVAEGFELTMVALSASELPTEEDWAVVYPISGTDPLEAGCVYGNCVAKAVGESSFEPTTKVGTVTVDAAFIKDSPGLRIYFANQQVRYCVTNSVLTRTSAAIGTEIGTAPTSLMAEYIRPAPYYFYRDPAAFSPSEAGLRLEFERSGERVIFHHKLEPLNVP